MCLSFFLSSRNKSNEWITTGVVPVFFHQCVVGCVSGVMSPALCTIGTAQVLAYSVISPDEIDQRRPVAMAVPRHHAAGADVQPAHAEQAAVDRDRLLGQIGRRHDLVGHGLGRLGGRHRLALAVGHDLVGRAFARLRGHRGHGGDGGQRGQRDEAARARAEVVEITFMVRLLGCGCGIGAALKNSVRRPAAFDRQHRAGDRRRVVARTESASARRLLRR